MGKKTHEDLDAIAPSPMTAERVVGLLRSNARLECQDTWVMDEAAGLIEHLLAGLHSVSACCDPSQSARARTDPVGALANADCAAYRALAQVYQDAPKSWAAREGTRVAAQVAGDKSRALNPLSTKAQ